MSYCDCNLWLTQVRRDVSVESVPHGTLGARGTNKNLPTKNGDKKGDKRLGKYLVPVGMPNFLIQQWKSLQYSLGLDAHTCSAGTVPTGARLSISMIHYYLVRTVQYYCMNSVSADVIPF
jgi:hypothetical protein